MPHVATSPARPLAALSSPFGHLDGDRLVLDDEAGFRDGGIRDPAWTAAFSTDEPTNVAAQWLAGGRARPRCPIGQHPGPLRGPGRGEVHGFTVPAINFVPDVRHGSDVFEAAEAADVGAVILELARRRADLHLATPDRICDLVLAGAIAANWSTRCSSRATTPVQCQEVRRRSRGDDRGDPARLPDGHRCRLPQHRHQFVHPFDLSKSTVDEQQGENYRRAAELTDSSDARERRLTVSVGGEIGEVGHPELDGRRASRVPGRLPPRARRSAPGAKGISR